MSINGYVREDLVVAEIWRKRTKLERNKKLNFLRVDEGVFIKGEGQDCILMDLLVHRHGEEDAKRMTIFTVRGSLSLFPPVDNGGKDSKQLP